MAFSRAVNVLVLLGFFFGIGMGFSGRSSNFEDLFQPSFAADDHFIHEGEVLKLKLDNYSGAGFTSKNKYMYGKASVQMKLVPGDSAGTVAAFYLSSDGQYRNEFDFEFLGNTSGEPILVQTNIYVNGVGNREQRFTLWFDPTTEFHTYSLLWNTRHVLFMIDETAVRLMKNGEARGIPFPKGQPMGLYSSLWEADQWATQGGRVKIDWNSAPFIVSYKNFKIDACECTSSTASSCVARRCDAMLPKISAHQRHQLIWVMKKHMVYDYCADKARFNQTSPPECAHHSHNYKKY